MIHVATQQHNRYSMEVKAPFRQANVCDMKNISNLCIFKQGL